MTSFSQLCDIYYDALLHELQQADDRYALDMLQKAEQSVTICRAYLQQLKKQVLKRRFVNKTEEIEFFKIIKPLFTGRLLYYAKLFTLHANWPAGSERAQLAYVETQLEQVTKFFKANKDFYRYYRTGCTHLDNRYFLRGNGDIRLTPGYISTDADPAFSTPCDYLAARILCNDLLQEYLQKMKQEPVEWKATAGRYAPSPLRWSGQKVDLAELIYALHVQGVFNNGRISVNEIARYLSCIFKIDAFDCHRVYGELRMRKTGRTKFLDLLREGLHNRIEEQD